MDAIEFIKKRIAEYVGAEGQADPNSSRLTFIQSDETVLMQKVREHRVWYVGSADELQNHYTNVMVKDGLKEPIYNRNKRQFFWGISSMEYGMKKVHSGLPKAIVDSLSSAIGDYSVETKDEKLKERIDSILEANRLNVVVNQQQMPLTLVEGWGAFKVDIDPKLSRHPIISYYSAENVDFVVKSNVLIGIIYKTYYKFKGKDYLLLETRRVEDGTSIVEYNLFRQGRGSEAVEVDLSEVPAFADNQDQRIARYGKILGVKSAFFFDPNYPDYGRSIYEGKITLFDDLDQILSQDSQTVRVSTPVEYFPADLLETDKDGRARLPSVYNRQYIKTSASRGPDGEYDGQIKTTQPQLNFSQYALDAREKINMILVGIMSPASLGFDLSKRDNAMAQREKERITMLTRNNVIASQQRILKELIEIALDMQDQIDGKGFGSSEGRDFSVRYAEFDSPTINSKLDYLVPAWTNGAISTERYVDLLWGDKLTDEQKKDEIDRINERSGESLIGFDELDEGNGAHSVL